MQSLLGELSFERKAHSQRDFLREGDPLGGTVNLRVANISQRGGKVAPVALKCIQLHDLLYILTHAAK